MFGIFSGQLYSLLPDVIVRSGDGDDRLVLRSPQGKRDMYAYTYFCTYIYIYAHTHIHNNKHAYMQTYIHTDRQTDRQTYIHTSLMLTKRAHTRTQHLRRGSSGMLDYGVGECLQSFQKALGKKNTINHIMQGALVVIHVIFLN